MKVVYNPNKNQEELFRVTCDNCESVMEVTKDDCHVGTWGMPQITCPVCGEECVMEELCGEMTQKKIRLRCSTLSISARCRTRHIKCLIAKSRMVSNVC